MVYNGYYKVMSNIPKMGHLTTPDYSYGPLSFQNLKRSLSWPTLGRHDVASRTFPAYISLCV